MTAYIVVNSRMALKTDRASSPGTMDPLIRAIFKKTKDTERDFTSPKKAVSRANGNMIRYKGQGIWSLVTKELAALGITTPTKSPTSFSDFLINFFCLYFRFNLSLFFRFYL